MAPFVVHLRFYLRHQIVAEGEFQNRFKPSVTPQIPFRPDREALNINTSLEA